MRVSPSALKTFGICARQYYYSNILKLAEEPTGSLTALGTVIHYVLDVYENFDNDLDLAQKTFEHYWTYPHLIGVEIDFFHRGTDWEKLRQRGLKMLEAYHDLGSYREGRLVGTEIRFLVPIGDHQLSGVIDKLWFRPGQKMLEAIDFKTGAVVPEKLKFNIQFTAYCYATTRPEFWVDIPGFEDGYERFSTWRRGGWWYHARDAKMFNAGTRDTAEYNRLALAVDEMAKAVDAKIFPLNIQGENCGYCPHVDFCGTEMEGR